jgi:flagellar hook-associated protein 2
MSAISSTNPLSTTSLLTGTSPSSSSLNPTGISFTGLGSGIDTSKIVDGLLAPDKAAIQTLQTRQSNVSLQQQTYKALQAGLLDLQGQANNLARSVGGPFDARSVTSSDDTAIKAAASSSAVAGVYSLTVKTLAQNHQIASAGFADINTTLATGALQIKVGNGATTTINVDSTNNTLQGLANAINNSGADVTASVINDGSATPYRLLLSANSTGAANNIQITNGLTGSGAAINLDPATQTIQAAGNAQIVLGSGSSGLTINSASNTVDNVISGVTINLLKANPTTTLSLTVSNDTAGAQTAINNFVQSFNSIIDFIAQRSTYDPQTKKAGLFLGDQNAQNLQRDLTQVLNTTVPGLTGSARTLSAIGITFDANGKLAVDSNKLSQALSGQLNGVSFDDVRRLFAFTGTSTNPGVTFILAGSKTQAPSSPVQVDITSAAQQASLAGNDALASSITITSANQDVALSLNGSTTTIHLATGQYQAAGLAQELQTEINQSKDLNGSQVAVTLDSNNKLKITTQAFGSSANVTIQGGTALGDLQLSAGQSAAGADVAGKFIVNGVDEAATGSGQILTGLSGNANTDGLTVRVTLTAPAPEVDAQLTLTRGLASSLNQTLKTYVDPTTGRLKNLNDSFQQMIDNFQKTIDFDNTLLAAKQTQLTQRFTEMETIVSQLKSTSAELTTQLANLLPSTSSTTSSSSQSSSSPAL